jgi:nucleotide-binding universal stress UspA family protein
MATSKQLRVLVAVDDSPAARAAIATVVQFPWPDATHVRAVVALRQGYFGLRSKVLDDVLEASLQDTAASVRRALQARFANVEVSAVNKAPIDAILSDAGHSRADIIALGWSRHGTFRRVLAGSVSRTVAAHTEGSILVARTTPKTLRTFLVGFDDSRNARGAVSLLSRLQPVRGSRVVLVTVTHVVELPKRASRLPRFMRTKLRGDVAALNEKREQQAQRASNAAARQLQRAGWKSEQEVCKGPAIQGLLDAARLHRADVLVLGARTTSGLDRVLLGSVAEVALERWAKPLLLVR